MKELRQIIGENLTELRKSKNLTQLGLAEKFNYSDKAVSKWENGDTLPDVETLQQLCEFYGVTLDFLTHDGSAKVLNKVEKRNRIFFAILVCLPAWMLATIIFVYTLIAVPGNHDWHIFWPIFTWAVPITCVLALVCNRVFWRNKIARFVCLSVLMWSVIAVFYITSSYFNPSSWMNLWSLFLLGIPIQAALSLWFSMGIKKK